MTKLAAATGESNKLIWQSMLELSGVKKRRAHSGKNSLPIWRTWLQARQTLSLQHAPTLHTLQAALKQPLEPDELTAIKEYAQHTLIKFSRKRC
ncbi:Div protein [Salmonella sp. NCTC 11881]|nr:Div protein [Salmonella sp. NCTC 11881]